MFFHGKDENIIITVSVSQVFRHVGIFNTAVIRLQKTKLNFNSCKKLQSHYNIKVVLYIVRGSKYGIFFYLCLPSQ